MYRDERPVQRPVAAIHAEAHHACSGPHLPLDGDLPPGTMHCAGGDMTAVPTPLRLAAVWGDAAHSNNNHREHVITRASLPRMHLLFRVALPAISNGAAVYRHHVHTQRGVLDLVFLSTIEGDTMALDAQTGATVWSHRYRNVPCSRTDSLACEAHTTPAIARTVTLSMPTPWMDESTSLPRARARKPPLADGRRRPRQRPRRRKVPAPSPSRCRTATSTSTLRMEATPATAVTTRATLPPSTSEPGAACVQHAV